jgi:hypothetical protein
MASRVRQPFKPKRDARKKITSLARVGIEVAKPKLWLKPAPQNCGTAMMEESEN